MRRRFICSLKSVAAFRPAIALPCVALPVRDWRWITTFRSNRSKRWLRLKQRWNLTNYRPISTRWKRSSVNRRKTLASLWKLASDHFRPSFPNPSVPIGSWNARVKI
uniref:Putative secreted peptide n=1 Tax=Anopheles braziliensis TaxID=58242 RepID=A0A2M3ZVV9_9DIPT